MYVDECDTKCTWMKEYPFYLVLTIVNSMTQNYMGSLKY